VRKPPSKEAIFHPRLSTGRDTLAAVFVIVCIIAILIGGMTLALEKRSTSIAWPKLGLKQVFKQVEATVTRFMAEQFSHVGEKRHGHLLRGKTFVQKKSYAKGLHELDKAIEVDPDSYEAHFWRGRALVKTGRDDDAIAAFETTIKLNPGYSYAYDNLGWIYLRRSDYGASLDYLNRSLALKPENGWAYYNRGRIHFQMGQMGKGVAGYRSRLPPGLRESLSAFKAVWPGNPILMPPDSFTRKRRPNCWAIRWRCGGTFSAPCKREPTLSPFGMTATPLITACRWSSF
jgi:tetratricopeptide (TPR) repeat protein